MCRMNSRFYVVEWSEQQEPAKSERRLGLLYPLDSFNLPPFFKDEIS